MEVRDLLQCIMLVKAEGILNKAYQTLPDQAKTLIKNDNAGYCVTQDNHCT